MATYILPNPLDIRIHPQPFQNQNLNLLLHAQLLPRLGEQPPFFNLAPQQTPPARQPKEDKVEFPARQELHRDVEEAGVAGAVG